MPELSAAELASSYGWAMATLNSIPDLKRVFSRAVAETWTPAKFVAEVRNTRWFRSLPASAREAAVLRTSDPREYSRRVAMTTRRVADMFGQMVGAHPTSKASLQAMAVTALTFGWTDEELRTQIGAYYDWQTLAKRGDLGGLAGQIEGQLERTSHDYGVQMSREWLGTAVRRIFAGSWTTETAVNELVKYAKSAFPHLRAEIEAGRSLRDLADPYIQTMSRVLELPDSDINLFDPTIRRALQGQGISNNPDGKPAMEPLWAFENRIKRDPRWAKTKNAQDAQASLLNSVLRNLGRTA